MDEFWEEWYSLTREKDWEYEEDTDGYKNWHKIPNPPRERIFEKYILEWEAHKSIEEGCSDKVHEYLMLDLGLTMLGRIDSTTIVSITEREEDNTKNNRGRDSITANNRNRVTDSHDLDREGGKSLKERNDIENEIHIC